jgi:septum formation protein
LIRLLRLPVEVQVSAADETVPGDWSPSRIVEELSLRKAGAVVQSIGQEAAGRRLVVGSDTIVVLEGTVLGKPKDAEDAVRMLRMLQGREHMVYSGAACLWAGIPSVQPDEGASESGNPETARESFRLLTAEGRVPAGAVGYTASRVKFRAMTEEEIRAYVKSGDPLDKAGSYGIQGLGSVFVERIEGDFYSIMGLPVSLLYSMLNGLGVHPL